MHLRVVPLGPPLFEWMVGSLAKKVIYDIDDLIFLMPQSAPNPLISLLKSRNNSIQLMIMADHVIKCTPALDSFLKQYNGDSTDISSTVDIDMYEPINPYKNDHKLIIGWSGSLSTLKYLHLLDEVFQNLASNCSFKLHVMSSEAFELEGVDVQVIPWNASSEIAKLQRFDIGVYPLPDEPWVYGKSGLNVIQYMALGIPTIAIAIGANFRVIDHGVDGFLVDSVSDWKSRIVSLMEDVKLRKEMGLIARKKVEEKFSVQSNASRYLSIINNLT